MSYTGQSELLQALGWATLSSFWQMGLLWASFCAINSIFRPSAPVRYRLSVTFLLTGFLLFIYTACSAVQTGLPFQQGLPASLASPDEGLLPLVLEAASLAYLILLAVPAYQLYRNWTFVRRLRRLGVQKADLAYRLFTEKTRKLLGIKRPVAVYFSSLVNSPLTIGYLKPVILLPVSGFTGLTPTQAEAILLHELSHIRRLDYLVNLLLTTVQTLLYFNPFVRFFLRQAGAERELSCDRLVLQFGYDPLAYAGALLSLERQTQVPATLAMASSGKSYLRFRVEQIVGMPGSRPKAARQPLALFMGGLILLLLNGLLFRNTRAQQAAGNEELLSFTPGLFVEPTSGTFAPVQKAGTPKRGLTEKLGEGAAMVFSEKGVPEQYSDAPATQDYAMTYVAATGATLRSEEEKAMVNEVVDQTKEVLKAQWPQVEAQLGEVLTLSEKRMARADYLAEVEAIDWNQFEGGLLERYEVLDWNGLYGGLAEAKMALQMDSLDRRYNQMLALLSRVEGGQDTTLSNPFPDQSKAKIGQYRQLIEAKLDSLKSARKPVIKL